MKQTNRQRLNCLFFRLFLMFGGLLAPWRHVAQADEGLLLSVTAQADYSPQLLLRYRLPATQSWEKTGQQWVLQPSRSQHSIPVQMRPAADGAEMLWRLESAMSAGETRSYQLQPVQQPADSEVANRFQIHEADGDLVLQDRDQPLWTYNLETDLPPEGVASLYQRSGYIHPLYSPAGHVLTDDFPIDHYHQHGLFFAWVNTKVGSTPVDFWNQGKGQGTVRHKKLIARRGGKVTAELVTQLAHVEFPQSAQERVVLEEQWDLLLHSSDQVFISELFSRQQNVIEEPVRLEKYHYGGFGVRGAAQWSAVVPGGSQAEFLTRAGKDRQQGNHTPATWVRMSGPVLNPESRKVSTAGIVLISHPDNLRAPQKVRLHPDKPYFCFCPVVDEAFVLEPGETLCSRYLIVTYDGDLQAADIEKIAQAYCSPPVITRLTQE